MRTHSFLLQDPAAYQAAQVALNEIAAKDAALGVEDPSVRRRRLLKDAGFKALKASEPAPKLANATMLYPNMSIKNYDLWKKYLPTEVAVETYQGVAPTDDALEDLKVARELGCFNKLLVWTNGCESMIVGVYQKTKQSVMYFPIVRWGEKLPTLKQIHRRQLRLPAALSLAGAVVVAGIVLAFVFFGGTGSNGLGSKSVTPSVATSSVPASSVQRSAPVQIEGSTSQSAAVKSSASRSVTSTTAASHKDVFSYFAENLLGILSPFVPVGVVIIVLATLFSLIRPRRR